MGPETTFRNNFVGWLFSEFPDVEIKPNTGCGIQGYPDVTVRLNGRNAYLEFKQTCSAKLQPNQQWYITELNKNEFARFVYPENAEVVMEGLSEYFNRPPPCDIGREQLSLAEL
jgi:hypothetical protein